MAKNNNLLLLAIAGAGGYYAYTQGWLCSLLGPLFAPQGVCPPGGVTPVATPPASTVVQTTVGPVALPGGSGVQPAPGSAPVLQGGIPTMYYPAGKIPVAVTGSGAPPINVLKPVTAVAGVGRFVYQGARRNWLVFPRRHVAVRIGRNYRKQGGVVQFVPGSSNG